MLFRGSSTDNKHLSAVDSEKIQTEAAILINSKQWLPAYHMLNPIAKDSDNVVTLYNISVCYYFIDKWDDAILLLQKILTMPFPLSKTITQNNPIEIKLNQLETQSENYLLALMPIMVSNEPTLIIQRTKRLLIDLYMKKSAWNEVLHLARQLEKFSFPNVVNAQQLALQYLKSK